MTRSSVLDVKREKKKSLYLRELSTFIDQIASDHPKVREVYVSRVDLSADGGICYIYFSTLPQSGESERSPQEIFEAALEVLKLFKPSLRKGLAAQLQARYTPELMFLYDEKKEKIDRIHQLLDQVQQELEPLNEKESEE